MALPKSIKKRVSLLALQDAADGDFGSEDSYKEKKSSEDEPDDKEMECPECGHKGPESEFEPPEM